jgi:hypothetical protein
MNTPGFGSLARDTVDKRRKTHDNLQMKEAPAASAITTPGGRRASLAAAPLA